MRIRTTLLSVVALAASVFGPQAPASAQSAATLTGTMTLSCFGCGTVTDGNNWSFSCIGICDVDFCIGFCDGSANDFTISSPPGDPNCVLSGTMNGVLTIGGRTTTFDLTYVGNTWVMSSGFGTASGLWAVTSPLGASPCGGPVSATFEGTMI